MNGSRISAEVVTGRVSLSEEMGAGDLGDARLNARRTRLIQLLEQRPDVGFPEACGDDSEAEGLYRFLRNGRVSLPTVIEPHLAASAQRCHALGEVLVIHDTTEVTFAGESERTGLTRQSPRRQGFSLHVALAVSADNLRMPLGLLALTPIVRPARARGRRHLPSHRRFAQPDKESQRWDAGVVATGRRLGPAGTAIHVMDREGDSYQLFAAMVQRRDRFIVRLQHDRRVVPGPEAPPATLGDALPRTTWCCERQVPLSARRIGDRSPKSRQQQPPRARRVATLRFAARPLIFFRPSLLARSEPATLQLNVVYGWEVDPPSGEVPVEWRLVTSEPIDTAAHVLRIIDGYRARWLVEEFFKALKTGCAYEKRQLESLNTLLVALALLAPIAWQLLLLRHLARDFPETPATVVLTRRQLEVLRAVPRGARLSPTPTVIEALAAVARLGGHLPQNGPPGWLVLTRGMQTLRAMEVGWSAAQRAARCDQS
jgi:hypothetical protein